VANVRNIIDVVIRNICISVAEIVVSDPADIAGADVARPDIA
jgi:hypothetical protein